MLLYTFAYNCFTARWFVFGLVQITTLGKYHFWVFPNLDNEKCGFVDSFKPFYSLEFKKSKKKSKKEKSSKGEETKEEKENEKESETNETEESKSQNGTSSEEKAQSTELPI